MSLIVSPSANSNWTLTRENLCDSALRKIGRLGAGDTPSAEDRTICLNALDSVLKFLAIQGYKWPKAKSTSSTVSFGIGVASVAMPANFYNLINLNWVDSGGNENDLKLMDSAEYTAIESKTLQGNPQKAYIDNFNVLYLYPVPSTAITVKVYYEEIILNSVAGSAVDLDSPWMIAIPYGIACEIGDDFVISDAKLARMESKWAYLRGLLIQGEAPNSVNQVSVDD